MPVVMPLPSLLLVILLPILLPIVIFLLSVSRRHVRPTNSFLFNYLLGAFGSNWR